MTSSRAALLLAQILTGLSAGFFFTYEASVTRGLAQVDDQTYVLTFQAINDTIRNPAFGIVFFGAIPAIALALALHVRSSGGVRWVIAASLVLYLATLAITAGGNVRLNNALAEVTSLDPAVVADARNDFEADWNLLNLLRTTTVIASFALLVSAPLFTPSEDG